MKKMVDEQAEKARINGAESIEITARAMDAGILPPIDAAETTEFIEQSIVDVNKNMSDLNRIRGVES